MSRHHLSAMAGAVICGLIILSWPQALLAGPGHNVLVIHSYHKGFTWTDGIDAAFRTVIDRNNGIEVSSEYLDSKRRPLETVAPFFADFLRAKFTRKKPDVIMVSDNNALSFLSQHYATLFNGIPVVFCGINDFSPQMAARFNGMLTGVVEKTDPEGTVTLISRLQPELKRLVIITGISPTAQAIKKEARTALAKIHHKFDLIWKDGLTTAGLLHFIETLSPKDAALLISFNRDKNGIYYSYEQSARLIAGATRAPVYGLWDFYLNTGLVGGNMVSSADQGKTAAEQTLAILKTGELPAVVKESPNMVLLDYKAMASHDLEVSDLPPGAVVLNRPVSFYEAHQPIILTAAAFILVLLALIAALTAAVIGRKESEKKYREIFHNGSDFNCIHDLSGNLLEINLSLKSAWGLEGDLTGVNLRNFILKPFKGRFDAYLKRILENGSDGGYYVARSTSGKTMVLEYRNKLILDKHGAPKAVQAAARDVTKRVMAEKALKESEDKYREILNYAPAGIYEFDMQTLKFTNVNDVMCEYTGYGKDEFLSLDPYAIIAPESHDVLNRLVEDVFEKQPDRLAAEYKVKGKTGREFWVLSNARFFYENHVPITAMAVVHDLTEIKTAEAERRKLELELQQARKMEAVGTLAGGIAHDFNNILSGILGYTQLAQSGIRDQNKVERCLKQVRTGAERAAKLVQQILTFSRQTEYEKKPVLLNYQVNDCLKLLRASIPATIAFQSELNSESFVMADQTKIHQLIMNLATNAYHAMKEDGGKIFISLEDVTLEQDRNGVPKGTFVLLKVTDTGHGMSREVLDKALEPYFTTKKMGEGTGLGLALVKAIVEEHNGFLNIESNPGEGTRFFIYLPVCKETIDPATEENDTAPESLSGNERIMVVDDETAIRELLKDFLEDHGYTVVTVSNGQAALDHFSSNPGEIDLVLTDMHMPELSGEKLATALLALKPDLPIILCTGYSDRMTETRADEIGIRKLVPKPFENSRMLSDIRSLLDQTLSNRAMTSTKGNR